MVRIVCLANSYKEQGRCLAGIDIDTKKWVRPVSESVGGTLPTATVEEIQLLDILELPLGAQGPDEGCQPENRLITGPWKKNDKMKPEELLDYCEDSQTILHNDEKSIPFEYFNTIPSREWKSLQLVNQKNVNFPYTDWPEGRKYKACLRIGKGLSLYLPLTDPYILHKLKRDETISKNCIITVSIATPWKKDAETPPKCYKVAAGVIEL